MNIRHRVTLSAPERSSLEILVKGGKGAVRRLKRAQILLAADAGSTEDKAITLHVVVRVAAHQALYLDQTAALRWRRPRAGAGLSCRVKERRGELDVGDEALLLRRWPNSAAPEELGALDAQAARRQDGPSHGA